MSAYVSENLKRIALRAEDTEGKGNQTCSEWHVPNRHRLSSQFIYSPTPILTNVASRFTHLQFPMNKSNICSSIQTTEPIINSGVWFSHTICNKTHIYHCHHQVSPSVPSNTSTRRLTIDPLSEVFGGTPGSI